MLFHGRSLSGRGMVLRATRDRVIHVVVMAGLVVRIDHGSS
jgi:hypothetical protein